MADDSVAPCQGLLSFWMIYPEFRYAPLRALFPAHPPGAIAGFGWDYALPLDAIARWRMATARSLRSAPAGAKDCSPECSASETPGTDPPNSPNPAQGVTET
jgi:hypothetical protein